LFEMWSSSGNFQYINAINNTLTVELIYYVTQGTSRFENSCFYKNVKANINKNANVIIEFSNCYTDYITGIAGIVMSSTDIVIENILLCFQTEYVNMKKNVRYFKLF
jgi:hypothetical protein